MPRVRGKDRERAAAAPQPLEEPEGNAPVHTPEDEAGARGPGVAVTQPSDRHQPFVNLWEEKRWVSGR